MKPGRYFWVLAAVVMSASCSTPASAGTVERSQFGMLDDGRPVEALTLTNEAGVSVRIITLGAAIQSLLAPDADGRFADIVLGYDTPQEYLDKRQYFGASVGRYANRIAAGRFELDGEVFQLETNDGDNHLHGGHDGFDRQIWSVETVEEGDSAAVTLSLHSPDGAGGYPGNLEARVTYALGDDNALTVTYEATTDAPTIVNLTNHAFFNLAGAGSGRSILDHELVLHADRFTPVDASLIPTGALRPVADTPFDFTTRRWIGDAVRDTTDAQIGYGRGYDHNWVLRGEAGTLKPAAELVDPASGRRLEIFTTSPAIQFYSGNFLDGTVPGKDGIAYRQGDALCLEPQTYPDSPNQPDFPSSRLDPGETYRNVIVMRFGAAEPAAPR